MKSTHRNDIATGRHSVTIRALCALAMSIACTSTPAQYAGDLFITPFSMGAHAGTVTDVRIEFFGGAKPLGHVRGTLTWNPQALQIDNPRIPEHWRDTLEATYHLAPGTLRFEVTVADNAQCAFTSEPPRNTCAPIGTVPVAIADARPIAPPGTIVELDLVLDAARCEGHCTYRRTGAMPAELVVVEAGLPIPSYGTGANRRDPLTKHANHPLTRRAHRIARGPGVIDLLISQPAFVERQWVRSSRAPSAID